MQHPRIATLEAMRAWVAVLGLAALAPAQSNKREIIKEAVGRLRSRSWEERARGARMLAALGPRAEPAVRHLVKVLDDRRGARRHAIEALKAIGPAAVPRLVESLRTRNTDVLLGICDVLAEKKTIPHLSSHAHALVELLKDKSFRVRNQGVALLAAIGTPAIDALLPALRYHKEYTRSAAVEALAGAGTLAVEGLGETLRNETNAFVREGICIALGRMGKKAAAAGPAIASTVGDLEDEVRAAAARAVGKTGAAYETAGPVLIAGLASESELFREGCIDGLAAYGAQAMPALIEKFDPTSAPERPAAIEACFRMRMPAIPALQDVLRDGTQPAKHAAIGLFVRFGALVPASATLPALRSCRRADDTAVRRAAAEALGELCRTHEHERRRRPSTRSSPWPPTTIRPSAPPR